MARIRTLKPEFPQSESIGRLSRNARLLYVNLITTVDDAGRARGSSRMLASLLYPYDNDAPGLIEDWLQELEREGCARRYEFEGSTYLDLPNFLKHQKIDKPSQSRLPKFEDGARIVAKPREVSAPDLVSSTSILDLGNGPSIGTKGLPVAEQPELTKRPRDLNGKAKIAAKDLDAEFDVWFAQYPKQDGPDAARAGYRSVRRSGRATAAELLQGAMRYSQEKHRTDPTYVKTAKNWLNDGDWKNAPQPPRHAPPVSRADSTAEGILQGMMSNDGWGGAQVTPSRPVVPASRETARQGLLGDLSPEDFHRYD